MSNTQRNLNPGIYDLNARVVFFPVRHHSPACAKLIQDCIQEVRPAAILIEGPADFNPKIDELYLEHSLPIAIYSYVRTEDGKRFGAFYPFCIYSPEWQALQVGQSTGAHIEFIDLPWETMAGQAQAAHRYADGALVESRYIPILCDELGVENFDDLWDRLFEIDLPELPEYLKRMHLFCYHMRSTTPQIRHTDLIREDYMVSRIREAMQNTDGRILVVTGGFHSSALFEALNKPVPDKQDESDQNSENPLADAEKGIALTPYSYERLDNLKGYESGMPAPGFYHHVWMDYENQSQSPDSYRKLLALTATMLREKKQIASSADLIAVETTAKALAGLRGQSRVWRRDIVDGIISALVKEEMAYNYQNAFLDSIYEVFRGYERGRLAEGTSLPPLVIQLQELLKSHELEPQSRKRDIQLDLTVPEDLEKSRILHQVRTLEIPGYRRTGGTDLTTDHESRDIAEVWAISWSPEYEAACIEAAIYGPSLDSAALARLKDQASKIEQPDADTASRILLQVALMGLTDVTQDLYPRLRELIFKDSNFFTVTKALGRLLYLYRFDEVLGTARHQNVQELLRTTFQRGLSVLETLGAVTGQDKELLQGVRALLETFERCSPVLQISPDDFTEVFIRIAKDNHQTPVLRGAASGVLWTLGHTNAELVSQEMKFFSSPEQLGDYLTGLFYLARESVQRQTDFIATIDGLINSYENQDFLTALPALRLAFSFFTPREKHHLAFNLFKDKEGTLTPISLKLNIEQTTAILAFETELFNDMQRYGITLKGAQND